MLARAGNAGQHLTQLGPDPRADGPPHLLRDCPGTGPDHNGRLLFACVIAGQGKSWVADANGRVGFQGRLHSRAPAEVGGQQASTRRRVGAGWRDAMASAAPMTEKRGKSRGGGSGGLGRWEGEGTWAGMAGWTGGFPSCQCHAPAIGSAPGRAVPGDFWGRGYRSRLASGKSDPSGRSACASEHGGGVLSRFDERMDVPACISCMHARLVV